MKKHSRAVSSRVLGVVECLVCTSEQRVRGLVLYRLGDADADGQGRTEAADWKRAYGLLDAGADVARLRRGGLRKDEEKFVSSEAPDVVTGAQPLGDGNCGVA